MQVLATVTVLLSLATALPFTSSSALPVDGVLKMLTRGNLKHLKSQRNAFLVGFNLSSTLDSTVVHAAIGRGVQNYTCSTNGSAAPVSVGAVANLYNVTDVLSDIAEDDEETSSDEDDEETEAVQMLLALLGGVTDFVAALPNPLDHPKDDLFTDLLDLELSGKHYYNPACLTRNCPLPPVPHFDLSLVGLGASDAVKNESQTAWTNYIPLTITSSKKTGPANLSPRDTPAGGAMSIISQIMDGQIQAPTAAVSDPAVASIISQIEDGQIQAPTAPVSVSAASPSGPTLTLTQHLPTLTLTETVTSTHTRTSSSTGPISASIISQIPDGQIQAPTAPVSVPADPSSANIVSQITDGQIQAPTAPVPIPAASSPAIAARWPVPSFTGTRYNSTSFSAGVIDIPWVELHAVYDYSSNAQWTTVYRFFTRYGAAPYTCAGLEGTSFSVDYAALYVFTK